MDYMLGIRYCVRTNHHFLHQTRSYIEQRDLPWFQNPSSYTSNLYRCFHYNLCSNLRSSIRSSNQSTRAITRLPSGISMLQRIGTGMVLSIICMIMAGTIFCSVYKHVLNSKFLISSIVVITGFVEQKRLQTAEKYGLIDKPNDTIPMSFWWLVPQYLLLGFADIFTIIGFQEFFYSQVPKELRSIGAALYLSVMGVGSLLSSLIVSIINDVTSSNGGTSWFDNNINEAHIDYFYWLLAAISSVGFIAFLYFAKSYVYV